MKQTLVDERHEETTLRFHRTLISPLLPCTLITEDRTVKAEGMFTIYLEVPNDVQLTSVQLNGQGFKVPFGNNNAFILTVAHLNKTQSFTLKVPLRDPVVIQQVLVSYRGTVPQTSRWVWVLIKCLLCISSQNRTRPCFTNWMWTTRWLLHQRMNHTTTQYRSMSWWISVSFDFDVKLLWFDLDH